jgi:hypothetical protein
MERRFEDTSSGVTISPRANQTSTIFQCFHVQQVLKGIRRFWKTLLHNGRGVESKDDVNVSSVLHESSKLRKGEYVRFAVRCCKVSRCGWESGRFDSLSSFMTIILYILGTLQQRRVFTTRGNSHL